MSHPPVLIESWLPIEAIGAESKRERGASSALPPLYFLHVWWARRPLTTSRAAILAGVLPQWSSDWPAALRERFPDEETYHKWFVHLIGIRGDPVKGRQLVDWAKAKNIKLDFHPYGGAPRAFTVNPSADDLELMYDLIEYTWGTRDLSVLDPFAGGGSIPFEALRYGFTTIANDLNPVAAVILKATLDYPARFGPSLAEDIRKWGDLWAQRVKEKLAPYFPKQPGESIFAYLWARTVADPSTGKPVPLSPNWWLRKGSDPVAVKLIAEPSMDEPRFEIVTGREVAQGEAGHGHYQPRCRADRRGRASPSTATTSRPRLRLVGWDRCFMRLRQRFRVGLSFEHQPTKTCALSRKHRRFLRKVGRNELSRGFDTNRKEFIGPADRSANYGMVYWDEIFSPRQLLSMSILAENSRSCVRRNSE